MNDKNDKEIISNQIDSASLSQLARLMLDFFRYSTRIAGKRLVGNITIAQLLILWKIEAGFNNVSDLSGKLRISPPAVSKMVDSMVEADLIVRIRSQEDRRVLMLKPTDKGQEILAKNKTIFREIMLEGFDILTQGEIDQLIEIFSKVNSHYELS